MKRLSLILLCVGVYGFAHAQFELSTDLSQAYAVESSYHLVFTNEEVQYEAELPQEFESYDSVSVIFHDTLTIENKLSMRMKVHLINSKTNHYLWQQIAVPLKISEPAIAQAVVQEDTPPTNMKYVQIGAFDHEEGAHKLSKEAMLFKTQIIKANDMWKVVIPYTVGLYSEVKKYHKDAFITFY